MDVLGMELAPNGKRTALVRYERDLFCFSRLEYFLNSIFVNSKSLADRGFVLYGNLYFGPFLHSQGFGLIDNVKRADVLDCHTFHVELRNSSVISIDNY